MTALLFDGMARAVRPGGHVVVGEPYWRRLPLSDDYEDRDEPWTTLEGTTRAFETSGLLVVGVGLGVLRRRRNRPTSRPSQRTPTTS